MPITQPSGAYISTPKIRDQSIVRKFVSQGGRGYLALGIFDGTPGDTVAEQSKATDADTDTISLVVYFNDVTAQYPAAPPGTAVATADSTEIAHDGTGMYHYDVGPALTQNRGTLTAVWSYQISGTAFTFTDYLQILNPMRFYDTLNDQEQSIVEQVGFMLGDCFDSTEGGPQLIEPFQTHYDYERLAQLERLAVSRFNLMHNFSNPPYSFGVGPGTQTVPPSAAGLLVQGTYLETVRHLVRSYTEIPVFTGTNVGYVDRTSYMQRWQSVFETDWADYDKMVRAWKIGQLNLARGAILGAGGYYGGNGYGGVFIAGGYAAQVRSMRFYPAAPSIGFGSNVAIYRGPA
jgi:hypothetical protein